VLGVPEHVEVRKVDMSIELQILAFHEQSKLGAARQVPSHAVTNLVRREARAVSS
jgi:hypothetical protein